MSATFLGDMAFQETVGSVLNVDPWGMDTLTRRVNGKSTAGVAYIATLARKRTIRDSEYTTLYLVDYSVTMNGAIYDATLTYKGIINSTVTTEPVIESGYRVQQITLPFFGSEATGITATFTIAVPWSRFRYVTPSKPSTPLYRGQVQVTKDALQIMGRSGAAGNLVIFAGKFLNSGIPGIVSGNDLANELNAYNAVAESITTQFERVPVGQWYQVTENNEVVIQPLDLAQAGYTAQLGIG
jgi:hypothetical protein